MVLFSSIVSGVNTISAPVLYSIYFIFIKCNISDVHGLLKLVHRPFMKQKYSDGLLVSFQREIDNIIKETQDQNEIDDLNNIKQYLKKSKREIKNISQIKLLSAKDKQEILIPAIKEEFLNYDSINDETKDKIIKNFEMISIKNFRECAKADPDKFQAEVIEILSGMDENFKIAEAEIYKKLIGLEIQLKILDDKSSEIRKCQCEEISNKYTSSFAELYEKTNYMKSNLCDVYSNLDAGDLSERIKKNQLECIYIKNGNKFLSDAIQVSIQRGNISREIIERIEKLCDKKNPENNLDILYWMTDIFHLVDDYELAFRTISECEKYDTNLNGLNGTIDTKLIKAHIITHLNEFDNAKILYNLILDDSSDLQKCECLFRIGELELLTGNFAEAKNNLNNSKLLTKKIKDNHLLDDQVHIKAERYEGDCYRRLGTTYLMGNEYGQAKKCYDISEGIYSSLKSFRGGVWLLHEKAELYRQCKKYSEAKILYEKSIAESYKVFNVNRVCHGMLGLAEINRLEGNPNLEEYMYCLNRYEKIRSEWGIINTNIGIGLIKLESGSDKGTEHIISAKENADKFGFKYESKVCDQILNLNNNEYTSFKYPLSHF